MHFKTINDLAAYLSRIPIIPEFESKNTEHMINAWQISRNILPRWRSCNSSTPLYYTRRKMNNFSSISNMLPRCLPALQRALEDGYQLSIEDIGLLMSVSTALQ